MKIIAFLILGIFLSLALVTYLEEVGIMVLAGVALGGLFTIIYQLDQMKK